MFQDNIRKQLSEINTIHVLLCELDTIFKCLCNMSCHNFITMPLDPGPATQLAKGYASLFQKTLRKGLFFCCLYVLDIGKKGSFFGRMSAL